MKPSLRLSGWAAVLLFTVGYSLALPALAAADSKAAPDAKAANQAFRKVSNEIDAALQADNAAAQNAPLSLPKGKGLRVLMTGHSWVAPGKITLPEIARAAGYTGHVQRDHTSGGASGSAAAIWRNEHGEDKAKPTRVILLPAIATGQWDVMTWGMYFNDTPHDFEQWMEPCLKANPAMVFYLQDGWPTPRLGPRDTPPEKMPEMLRHLYADTMVPMFRENLGALERSHPGKVHLIPAGAAVVEMIDRFYAGELPGFDCLTEINGGKRGIFSPDSFHLSRTSGIGWLVGYCYYGMLYQSSPELIADFHPKGVDPTVDRRMRHAAWQAIIHSPFTGLTDTNNNGRADQIDK